MPRLRVTGTLSLLALAIGAAGTQWLSDMTAGRATPPETGPLLTAHPSHRRITHPKPVVMVARPRYTPAQDEVAAAPAVAMSSSVTLVPIATPTSSVPTSRMENHALGNVVLHVTVDGQGQVTATSIAQTSGDDVLDANAMDIARHWRFAVPPDHPQGLSGDLPMRFTGELAPLAQMP
ncbi:TonB family protein [Dyella sp.]|jgi:protein TonB|uniref:energy transducer TonB family protein n=1 Tax=Dyella sp. TaxID=1869338 RepID=UPI002FD9228F